MRCSISPQSNDALEVRLDNLEKRVTQHDTEIAALQREHASDMQWAHAEHFKIHQEIIAEGKRIRDELIQEGRDMRSEVKEDITEIKEIIKSREADKRQLYIILASVLFSAFIAPIILHAMHII